jgi:hypothetical protein
VIVLDDLLDENASRLFCLLQGLDLKELTTDFGEETVLAICKVRSLDLSEVVVRMGREVQVWCQNPHQKCLCAVGTLPPLSIVMSKGALTLSLIPAKIGS